MYSVRLSGASPALTAIASSDDGKWQLICKAVYQYLEGRGYGLGEMVTEFQIHLSSTAIYEVTLRYQFYGAMGEDRDYVQSADVSSTEHVLNTLLRVGSTTSLEGILADHRDRAKVLT